MHTRVTPAVVPPLRWVMWAIPVFLFLIGFFHGFASDRIVGRRKAVCAAFAAAAALLCLLMRETHGRNIYDQLRGPTAREAA